MEQIHIGTCIPGQMMYDILPSMAKEGFERFEIGFHMEYYGVDLRELADFTKSTLAETGQKITALGYYCNPLASREHFDNLKKAIDFAPEFGTSVVSTFAGALPGESVDKAMPKFKEVFTELGHYAADRGVKIAFESCPMGGIWQSETCNISHSPVAWDMMFSEVPLENIGIEFEPAHALKQLIDPLPLLKKYIGKVFNVHGKDTTVDWDGIRHRGFISGIDFVPDRFPGFGDTNWRDVFYILHRNGYIGDISIEGFHDNCYNKDWEMVGQLHALNYLKWCRGGDFTANPWQK